jgi:type I restriction enzyme S subunit
MALLDLVTIKSGQVDPRAPTYRNLPLIAPDHVASQTGRLLKKESAAAQGAISGKYLVRPGDVIYSKIRPYLQKAYKCDFDALCSADMYPFTPQPGVDASFVLHSILGQDFTNFAASVSARSGIPKINREELSEYRMRVPPAPEQRAIGRALDNADGLIAALERMIAKKQAIKQGMIQELITCAAHAPGHPKDTWEERSLGQLLLRPPRYGINAAAVPLRPGVASYIRITDINDAGQFTPDPKVGVSHPNAANYRLASGELVFARTGASVGKSYLYDPRDGELVYAGFLINVAPDPKRLDPSFLAFYAQTKEYWDWVARTSARSGQPGINGQEYAQLPVALPSLETQNAIMEAVSDVDSEIDALGRRLEKAHMVKVGMMQELLTGRTRLPVKESAA